MANTTIQSTSLDFDQIKNKLKTFFQQQSEFADYDFEASGLSNLLDVLAWNTHINGLTANMALNESFLTTAQLRSSMLANSESLGYTPRSAQAATGYVTMQFTNTESGRSPTAQLNAGATFTASLDGAAFNFVTLDDIIAYDNGSGLYTFLTELGSTSIPIREGELVTKTFYVQETDDIQIYVIPDQNVDTTTLSVEVFESRTSTSSTIYTDLLRAVSINSSSRYYDLREAPNGFYELHFGDGITTGLVPQTGNKIVVTYLRTSGAAANRASNFNCNTLVSMNSKTYNIVTSTVTRASGGAAKESIASIRLAAPVNFAAQARMVTALDYEALIKSNYASVENAIAWGGQDNDPIDYGKVFVSLDFATGTSAELQNTVKNSIINDLTSNLAIMSVNTEFVDPVITKLVCGLAFNYNPNLTTLSTPAIQTRAYNTMVNFFTTNLSTFKKTFRRSNLLTEIDNISDAILNSRMTVSMAQEFTPSLTFSRTYTLNFPAEILAPTTTSYSVTTANTFSYAGYRSRIRNKLGTNTLQIVTTDGTVTADNIGSFDAAYGKVTIVGFLPTEVFDGSTIKILVKPANENTIAPLRNYILELDTDYSSAIANVDYNATRVSL